MVLKDLMVHLDPGERTAARVALAVALARRHDARLVGVFAQRAQAEQVGIVINWPSPEYVAAAAASKAAFEAATAGLRAAEWHDANRGGDSELLRVITEAAHYSDLIIVGQHDEYAATLAPPDLGEHLVVHSGRPVLVVPFAGEFNAIGARPLIAWDRSRESAHALNDALPLIEGCREAIVISLDTPYDEAKEACAKVAQHLACHGIDARTEVLVAEEEHVMDFLLNRVTDLDADLLVIGAHRQASFLRPSQGADSRTILRQMIVPTLVAR
jgi:nucleotide-binding universal stress UspA family protein